MEKENYLRGLRKDRNLTLQQAAKSIGLSWTYLQQLETGKRKGNLEIINKILNYYGYELSIIKCRPHILKDEKELEEFVKEKGLNPPTA